MKLPYERTLAAAGRLGDAPLAVLIELAYQAFKTHRNVVPLANAALRSVGVSPDAKVRALRRLEANGMVAVDWRGGKKTPLVTLLWYEPPNCRVGADIAAARVRQFLAKLPHWRGYGPSSLLVYLSLVTSL